MTKRFKRTLDLSGISVEELFAWHARPGAFERLAPPWQSLEILEKRGSITDGSVLKFRIHQGPASLTWEAHHEGYEANRQFIDVQSRGPFASWRHRHLFEAIKGGSRLIDEIEYALPAHALIGGLSGALVEPMLEQMFTFRHARTRHDLMRHAAHRDHPPQRVAITGASGTIGQALSHFLTTGGHHVLPITRRQSDLPEAIRWDIEAGEIEAQKLEGVDVVVHLAGESINQRWTPEAKRRIKQSRVQGTELISRTLAALENKPRALISASAVGYYGDTGDQIKTEESDPGENFLAEVCVAWEQSAEAAREAGVRVVHPRFGVVLTPQGGALEQMLPAFKVGAGGRIGSGRQYMSWVALDDVLGALHEAIFTPSLQGPVNVTAPKPVTNKEFTEALGRALHRPTFLPVPKFGLYALLGKEAARELLLEGQRVVPERLLRYGFAFEHEAIQPTLKRMLGRA